MNGISDDCAALPNLIDANALGRIRMTGGTDIQFCPLFSVFKQK